MPGRKRDAESRERFESAEEESEEDVKPKTKRQSTSKVGNPVTSPSTSKSEEKGHTGMQKNDQGESYAKLSEYRRVTVRTYNKKVLIDIREFYKDKQTGELKPGSKGISLTTEQWSALKGSLGDIDQAVSSLEDK